MTSVVRAPSLLLPVLPEGKRPISSVTESPGAETDRRKTRVRATRSLCVSREQVLRKPLLVSARFRDHAT